MRALLGLLTRLPVMGKVIPGIIILLLVVGLIYMRFGAKIGTVVLMGLLVIIILLLGLNLIVKWHRKRQEASFDQELRENSARQVVGKIEVQRALAELAQQWTAAVNELKKAGMTLFSLPWYMLIGEPQSGKSTTLRHSDLELPVGTERISGAGGTRNCDWWFTNEAVILDTAGRFTFQEENAPDREEWKSFLSLLKRHRADCPINGVIVVIPATSLLEDTPEERERKAKNIRYKLAHIQEVLEVRFPVFILITKMDRILGFTEFFSQLGAAQQRQLFGWSNQTPFDQPYDLECFPEVFNRIYESIHRWRLHFLSERFSLNLLDKLFVFPEEFYTLKGPLQEYLNTIFIPDRFHEPLFFRGFYFSSGLQQGRPVAKACRELLGGEGVSKDVIEELEQVFQTSRTFFIRDFYKKKVFSEQGLVVRSLKAQKRGDLIRRLIWVGGGTIAAVSLALLIWGVTTFRSYISPALDVVVRTKELLQTEPSPPIAEWSAISQALSEQRQRILKSHITAIFFRGKRNVVTEDLKKVHQIVFMNECLRPLVEVTEKRLVGIDWDVSNVHPDKFISALREYILWWGITDTPKSVARSYLSQVSILPFIELCSATSKTMGSYDSERVDKWLDDRSFSKDKIEEEFRYFVKDENGDPSDALTRYGRRGVIEPALERLEDYWEIKRLEGAGWWFTLIDTVRKANEAYRDILLLAHKEDEDPREVIQAFLEGYESFNANIEGVSSQLSQDVPAYQREIDSTLRHILRKCERVYKDLVPTEISDNMLKETVNSQKMRVLTHIEQEYHTLLRESIYEYPHMLKIHGDAKEKPQEEGKPHILTISLSEEAGRINNFLGRVRAFVNIYSGGEENDFQEMLDELKENIKDNPRDAHRYLQQWHDQQVGERDEIIKGLDEIKGLDLHERWGIKDLERVSKKITTLALWEREMAATRLYPEISTTEKETAPYSFASFRKTILEQNETLKMFSSNSKAYKQLSNKQLRYFYDYLKHWYGVYQGFRPDRELTAANDWRTFQRKVSSLRKPIFDPNSKPLKDFFENVPYSQMKDLLYETPGASLDSDIMSIFNRLEKAVQAYQKGVFDSFATACDEFVECVTGLDASPLEAWKKVSRAEEGLRAISRFKKTHRELRNELIATQLESIEQKAVALLKSGLKEDIVERKVDMPEEIGGAGVPVKFTLEFCKGTIPQMDTTSKLQYLREYTRYWRNIYENFIPGEKVIGAKDWPGFRYKVATLKTPLVNLADSPLELLLVNMDYREMGDIIDSIPGARADAEIKTNLGRLERALIGYQSKDLLVALEEAGNRFVECISSLEESPVIAWRQLLANKSKIDAIKAFSIFEKDNRKIAGEPIVSRLKDIENKAITLLRNEVRSEFISDWSRLMWDYEERLSNRFPFKKFLPERLETAGKFRFEIPGVEFSDLRGFLLKKDGLEGLIQKFNLMGLLSAAEEELGFPGDQRHKMFISNCLELRNFLFEQDKERTHDLQIRFSSGVDRTKAPLIGERFTRCCLTMPGGIRFTIREGSRGKDLKWKVEEKGEVLTIEGINEETGQRGVMEIYGGPLSFLSYVTTLGEEKKGWEGKRWIVPVELPDPEVKGGSVHGRFDIEFSRPIPKLPIEFP